VRIAFIGTRGVPSSYSGFETAVEQIGRRMVVRGHDVTVFCRSGHYRERPGEHRGMRLAHLPAVPQKHLETLTHTGLSALRLPAGAAVVCMGVGNAPVVRMLERAGRAAVFNVDGADWQRGKWGALASRYLRWCERLAAGGRSALIADAEAVRAYYRERYRRECHLVAYGGDAPRDRGTGTLRELALEPGGYVLCVRFAGYRFGRAYEQLSAHAGVYVLAASVGGTHPVLVEQMAAGNCVLARDTESNREVLGATGRLWRTPEELAACLRELWADPAERARLGAAARARAERRYSWERVTDAYLELCAVSLRAARLT
jgi:hypothetical protein